VGRLTALTPLTRTSVRPRRKTHAPVSQVLGFACAAAFIGAACPRHREQPAPPTTSPAEDARRPSTAPPPKPFRIAMIAKSSNNPSFLAARMGAENRARELSAEINVPIAVEWLTPPQEDAKVQAKRITQAVNDHVDAILVSISDAAEITPVIDDAVSRGVPVMTFDSDAPDSRRFAFCGVDDIEAGRAVMRELVPLVPAKAKVAILAGNEGALNLRQRVQGAKEEVALHPGLKALGPFFHVETPQAAAAEVLRVRAAHPEIKGWAMVGGWPLYTRTLLEEMDPAREKIVSMNALPAQLVYVEKGLAPVLLAQPNYLWGAVGVASIVDKVLLRKSVPTIIPMKLVRVTRDNLGSWARQLKDWGFADVPEEYVRLKN
jgi:ribose transport system substrate-binding protein